MSKHKYPKYVYDVLCARFSCFQKFIYLFIYEYLCVFMYLCAKHPKSFRKWQIYEGIVCAQTFAQNYVINHFDLFYHLLLLLCFAKFKQVIALFNTFLRVSNDKRIYQYLAADRKSTIYNMKEIFSMVKSRKEKFSVSLDIRKL